jgi:hypothetical protein
MSCCSAWRESLTERPSEGSAARYQTAASQFAVRSSLYMTRLRSSATASPTIATMISMTLHVASVSFTVTL